MAQNTVSLSPVNITIHADEAKAISPDLLGIFFEDINYAADGGLYAELIQNRSFEYSSKDHPDWNFFTAWELIQEGGACTLSLETTSPIHPNNPHYLVVSTSDAQGEKGLRNGGFAGMPITAGERYNISLFARALSGEFESLTVRLEGRLGENLGEATLSAPTQNWQKHTAIIHATGDDNFGRFVLLINGTGSLALDMISMFPSKTFHNRPNGLRSDLAQVIADLKPKFVRFPGGCLVHGDGLDNMYRWKDTIGPIEHRRAQSNIWNYHQSGGLGYFEYFQFCEDIGAKPLPVVPAGVCCPNTGAKYNGRWEEGQEGVPLDEMDEYVQEVLDLIEWANGPVTSTWGAKRAEAGHSEPFGLEYLGVGNEDRITPVFVERFKMIYDAVKAQYPDIVVIGTVGPRPSGEDYEIGWQVARDLDLEMVDEHGYKDPDWFWDNLERFDAYNRNSSAVYLGEYAAHDTGRKNTLRSALAEAAYLTSLERNGDIVRLSSYAPLLAKNKYTQWTPDLIYFDNTKVTPSINYYVQQLFSIHAGDQYLNATINAGDYSDLFTMSCVKDSQTGDVIIKLVSRADEPLQATINLADVGNLAEKAQCTVLTGDPLGDNPFNTAFHTEPSILPTTSEISIAPQFTYTMPAHSLTVIRAKLDQ